jgi:hypothetical protein
MSRRPDCLARSARRVGCRDRDSGFHRHAGTCESGVGVAGIETDANRESTHDFREIARGVVRRDERKFRPCGREYRFDVAANRSSRMGIYINACGITGPHAADLSLAVIGLDPKIVDRDDREHAVEVFVSIAGASVGCALESATTLCSGSVNRCKVA